MQGDVAVLDPEDVRAPRRHLAERGLVPLRREGAQLRGAVRPRPPRNTRVGAVQKYADFVDLKKVQQNKTKVFTFSTTKLYFQNSASIQR